MNRRNFMALSSAVSSGILLTGAKLAVLPSDPVFPIVRVPVEKRNFSSPAVEATIRRISGELKDKELAWMFGNCFPNTIDTTVRTSVINGRPDTFVITGDIDAMWLRDSTAQVWPYLPLMKQDAGLQNLVAGLINRQTSCILIDPYANAFYEKPGHSEWSKDHTEMKPELHERKWELDSLCYTVRLAYHYWKATADVSPFGEE
ncbi:MAG: glycoside hydrolase family 125 protein, partial [Bacteroidota bacterium]